MINQGMVIQGGRNMKKLLILILLSILSLSVSVFATEPLDADATIQRAIDEGKAAVKVDEGYQVTADLSNQYRVTTALFTPYLSIKNKALEQKVQLYNYTVEDAKRDFIDNHNLVVKFTIGARFRAFGTPPKTNFQDICSFVMTQGDKVYRPQTVEDVGYPTVKSGIFAGAWLIYEVKTTWDLSQMDLTQPLIVRCVIETKYSEHKYDLAKLK
jgi:hypothetical protein